MRRGRELWAGVKKKIAKTLRIGNLEKGGYGVVGNIRRSKKEGGPHQST